MKNQVEFVVKGRYALFTDPISRTGGEKFTYPIPTYQALKGIIESVYWKPSIIWVVDSLRVINQIKTQSKGIRPISYGGGNDLAMYTYLSDVEYQVCAHFEFNLNRPELEADRNEDKHYQIAKRMIERGGRRDVFLGSRECQAYVEPCCYGEGESYYSGKGSYPLGVMFHGFSYPDELGEDELQVRLWMPKMIDGEVKFIRPEECTMVRTVREMKAKTFGENGFSGLNEPGLFDKNGEVR